ncbi:MAG: M48 family metalloprotease, partial [Alphaproteobacteria bacterium]
MLWLSWKTGCLAALSMLMFAHNAAAQLPGDYPNEGKSIDQLDIDDDYSDVLAERPRSLSIMRARAHGFVPSDDMQSYVQSILTRVLDGIVLPPTFDPEIRILAAPDYGAVCTPDGTLVVSIGLLEQSDTEDEIAFILGHEVSHAILRHHDSDWFTRSQYYAV